jgi:hypothetical protein
MLSPRSPIQQSVFALALIVGRPAKHVGQFTDAR